MRLFSLGPIAGGRQASAGSEGAPGSAGGPTVYFVMGGPGSGKGTQCEKLVAEYSDKFVVIADYRKQSEKLGEAWDYVPIEVVPMAYKPVMNKIETQMGGTVKLRMAKHKVCHSCLLILNRESYFWR